MDSDFADWSKELFGGEKVLWAGVSSPFSFVPELIFVSLFFGTVAWVTWPFAFHYHSLAEACGIAASRSCSKLYYLSQPILVISFGSIASFVLLFAGQVTKLQRISYAITSHRALVRWSGVINRVSALGLRDGLLYVDFIGRVKVRDGRYNKVLFRGLSFSRADDAVYWASRRDTDQ